MVATQLMFNIRAKIATALSRQEGQGMVEYALIIVLVAIGVIVAITALRTQLQTVFNTIVNNLSTAS
jgi:pilus assembly protein Flp/PilA